MLSALNKASVRSSGEIGYHDGVPSPIPFPIYTSDLTVILFFKDAM